MKRTCRIVVFFTLIFNSSLFSQTTIVLQPDSIEGKDALLWNLEPDSPNGNINILKASAWTWEGTPGLQRSFIEFNLSVIPPNAEILDAKLSLFYHQINGGATPQTQSSLSGPNISMLQRIINEWDEHTVTWNHQPQIDTTHQVILPESTSPTQDYPNIEVTAIIQDMVANPSTSHGFLFRQQTEEYYRRMAFASSDHQVDSLHPKLVITFCACNPDLGNDTAFCGLDAFKLTPGTNYLSYLWQNGSTDSVFLTSNSGLFWVEVTDSAGCVARDSIQLTIAQGPEIFLGNDTLVCNGQAIILDAGAGFENYLWQDGSAGQTYFVTQPGTFWVQVGNLCGTSADTVNISFSEPFDIWLGSDTSFCYGQCFVLDAGAGFSEYYWQNGASTQNIVAANTGNYWVEVTDSLGCSATDTIYIETFMEFNISIGEDVVKICKGDYVFLNGPVGYQNYLWQDGSNLLALLADTAGIYWLEVTDENGCAARDSMQVIVNEIPTKLLENDTIICPRAEISLQALPGYSSYIWQDGSAGSVFTTNQPGKFWVTVQDEIGCSGTDTILVKPFQIPDLGLEPEEIICPGDTLILSPDEGHLSYLWQDGSIEPQYFANDEGNFRVQIETNCGFFSDSVDVHFYKGNLNLGNDTTLCDGELLRLNPGNIYSKYLWSNGSTESSILVSESAIYWLKAFDGICTISDTIFVETCASLWFPNVFTPNSDGLNDTFYAVATNPEGIAAFKMTIFNRWGRKVHEMGNVSEVWDGKINGSIASPGAYFWICNFAAREKSGSLKNHERQGSVTIIR